MRSVAARAVAVGVRPRVVALLAALALVGACTLPPLETLTPRPSPTPTPRSPTPIPTRVPSSASATPDLGAIPSFHGRDVVETTFAGLRVRDRPGTDARIVTGLLGDRAALEVVMGPLVVDDLGWYLVTDADADEPAFEEGWVAAGFAPEANLRSTGEVAADSPVVRSLAHVGDAEFGPIPIPDERHVIRWVAVDTSGQGCRFGISLTAGSGPPVPAIRSPVSDNQLVPGVLPSSFFVGQPELRGQIFLTAETDCAWTLAVLREEPAPSASP